MPILLGFKMSSKPSGLTINEALEKVGEPRQYHFYLLLWASIGCACTSMQTMVLSFTQATMGFRCNDEDSSSMSRNESHNFGSCKRWNTSIDCQSYVYNSTVYDSTVVSEFNLVCEDGEFYTTLTNSLFMLARIPAGFITGPFIDRVGRRKTLMLALLLLSGFGLGAAYSVNIAMYISFRALSAFAIMGVYDSSATLISEVTTPNKRPHMLIGLIYSWGAGILILSPLGYWLRGWRNIQMAVSLPSIPMCLLAYWVIDESPHWLYSQGKVEEAQKVLNKIASWNHLQHEMPIKLRLPDESHDSQTKSINQNGDKSKLKLVDDAEIISDTEVSKPNSCLQILRARQFLVTLAICAFGWLACNMGYSGLVFGLSSLGGDVYINNMISGFTEIVSYCLCFFVIPGGRKRVYVVLLAFGGAGLIVSALARGLLSHMTWLIILTTMIGRLSVAAGWQILFLWCIELFPTTFRVTMLEISMMVGHIGSTAAPFINDLHKLIKDEDVKGEIIAPAVYGVMLLFSSILSIYLPETNNRALPISIEEATSDNTPLNVELSLTSEIKDDGDVDSSIM